MEYLRLEAVIKEANSIVLEYEFQDAVKISSSSCGFSIKYKSTELSIAPDYERNHIKIPRDWQKSGGYQAFLAQSQRFNPDAWRVTLKSGGLQIETFLDERYWFPQRFRELIEENFPGTKHKDI